MVEDSDRFNQNLKKWSVLCPKVAKLFPDLDVSAFTWSKTQAGETNLAKAVNGNLEYYHSCENAAAEAQNWFSSLVLRDIKIVYIFGVGLGYYLDAAKDWLLQDDQRVLVFLENDLGVIKKLFETDRGSLLLANSQVLLHYLPSKLEHPDVIEQLTASFVLKEYICTALNYYRVSQNVYYEGVIEKITFISNLQTSFAIEYLSYGKGFFTNFFQNLFLLPSAYSGSSLFGKFKNVPAIICGAGPSLEKNSDCLATLRDKALIFAGGTSMNALNASGFVPHFGIGIDPNWSHYTRLFSNLAFDAPYFYRNRMFHDALTQVQGDRLYVTGSMGYEISKWFERKLGIEGIDVPEGFNVVNFTLALAQAMGCNPILFVGVDLAYTNKQSYRKGIFTHPIHDRRTDFQSKKVDEELLTRLDIYGTPVLTLWKWVNESLWFANYAMNSPDTIMINCTEGGLGFPGIPNIPLSYVAENILKNSYDFDTLVHGEIQNNSFPDAVSEKAVLDLMIEFRNSLEKARGFCFALKEEFERIAQDKDESVLSKSHITDKAQKIIDDFHKEDAYDHVLKTFDERYLQFFGHILQQAEMDGENPCEANAKRAKFFASLYGFLMTTAFENIKLINFVLSEQHKRVKEVSSTASSPQMRFTPSPQEVYSFENGILKIIDPELNLEFNANFKPEKATVKLEDQLTKFKEEHHPHGQYVDHYPDGSKRSEQFYLEGLLHGPSSFWDLKSTLLGRKWYFNGKAQGKARYWYRSGNPKAMHSFKDGQRHGRQENYYQDGTMCSLLNYSEGQLDGEILLYYSSGKLKRKLHFSKGKRHGSEKMWNESGLLTHDVHYDMNRPTGIARTWYHNGNIAKEVVFNDQNRPEQIRRWNIDGRVWADDTEKKGSDYFDDVAKKTTLLTESFEKIVKGITGVESVINKTAGLERSDVEQVEIKFQILSLKKNMERMKELNQSLLKESGLSPDCDEEMIWKSGSQQKQIKTKLEEATSFMTQDIVEMQKALGAALSKLVQKGKVINPPQKPEEKQDTPPKKADD